MTISKMVRAKVVARVLGVLVASAAVAAGGCNDEAVPEQGPPGEKGEKGDPGERGPAGESGAKGPQGLPGQEGRQGEPGRDGLPGADGAPGEVGPEGKQGPAGKEGPTGEQGVPGQAGPAGARGPEGPAGPEGPQGAFPGALMLRAGFDGLASCNTYCSNLDGRWGAHSETCVAARVHTDGSAAIAADGKYIGCPDVPADLFNRIQNKITI